MSRPKGIKNKVTVTPENSQKTVVYKFGIESKVLMKGGMAFSDAHLVISMIGNKPDIRGGIIKAMIADQLFAQVICDSAEYFKAIK